jgi:hypothetical protein
MYYEEAFKKMMIKSAGDILITQMNSARMRDLIHNLDPEDELDLAYYREIRHGFVKTNEGSINYAYNDKDKKLSRYDGVSPLNGGSVTVGAGFNMSRYGKQNEARREWNEIFANYSNKPDFDEVYNGRATLNNEQIDILLDGSLDIREKELRSHYGIIWQDLRMNER